MNHRDTENTETTPTQRKTRRVFDRMNRIDRMKDRFSDPVHPVHPVKKTLLPFCLSLCLCVSVVNPCFAAEPVRLTTDGSFKQN
ncbi:MAG: hypothetical protein L0241_05990, partial [Planctomycetia bacterium]|nr:hypothetical protein [Planctomycetia bacterium]